MDETRAVIQKFLASRKAWASLLGVMVLVALVFIGADVDTVTKAAATVVAVYTGSVALEDGLRSLAALLRDKVE